MTVVVETMSAAQFRAYRRAHSLQFDRERGLAWFASGDGKLCCTDRVSLWNNTAGGPDDVVLVVADDETEAVRALERVRPGAIAR